jgi:choline-sulfatase
MLKQYNILFIMTDQFAFEAIGAWNPVVSTPNLDQLVNSGIVFERCYTNSPLCLPARAALATGLYPQELGLIDNYGEGLDIGAETWMQALLRAGYASAVFGKVHLHRFPKDMRETVDLTKAMGYEVVDELPGPRTYASVGSSYYDYLQERGLLEIYRADIERRAKCPFDATPTPLPTEDYADVYIANRAIEHLSSYAEDRPWFCTVSFGGPHDPWDAPQEYVDRYLNTEMPLPRVKPISRNIDRPKGVYDEILNGKYDLQLTQDILQMTMQDIEALRRSYYGHVSLIDEQIGRILQCVTDRGEMDRTIIVFTSDHGEQNGDYGLLFKQTFFESSVRVPLVFSLPANHPMYGVRRYNHAVELLDVGATVCHLAGIDSSYGHARSLLSSDENGKAKQTIVSQIFGETMALHDSVKAVWNRDGAIYLLFDLNCDPFETDNLAGTAQAQELEGKMNNALLAQARI